MLMEIKVILYFIWNFKKKYIKNQIYSIQTFKNTLLYI